MTDGKAVSIVLRKPKKEVISRKIDLKQFPVQWGLDPGRRDLFVAINNYEDKLSCSTREFYEDGRYKKRNQKIKHWYDNREDILEATRNMPTKKTASLVLVIGAIKILMD